MVLLPRVLIENCAQSRRKSGIGNHVAMSEYAVFPQTCFTLNPGLAHQQRQNLVTKSGSVQKFGNRPPPPPFLSLLSIWVQ